MALATPAAHVALSKCPKNSAPQLYLKTPRQLVADCLQPYKCGSFSARGDKLEDHMDHLSLFVNLYYYMVTIGLYLSSTGLIFFPFSETLELSLGFENASSSFIDMGNM